jgi:hypothetical protein
MDPNDLMKQVASLQKEMGAPSHTQMRKEMLAEDKAREKELKEREEAIQQMNEGSEG